MTGFNFKEATKKFGNQTVLNQLNVTVPDGSFVSVVGSSGCGKSTLLRVLAGLESLDQGSLQWSSSQEPHLSFVFQESNLLPWRNLYENVHLPFELGSPKAPFSSVDKDRKVKEALELVQLQDVAQKFPHELSGGMKMRASLARALVTSPQVLLLDEPFSALDEITRFQLQEQLQKIWTKQKLTVVFVTHSLSEAVFLSERVLILKSGHFVLDTKIQLPTTRSEQLRQSSEYQQETARLSQVFREDYV